MATSAKRALSFEQIDAQTAVELPDRDMMALVSINIINVANGLETNVQVPIGVAANVCGLSVAAVLAAAATGPVDCTSATTADLPVHFR